MNRISFIAPKAGLLIGVSALVSLTGVSAAPLNLPDTPLVVNASVPPINMLVVGRDHKLYYEAYNDASDLDDDGSLDVGYKGHLASGSGGIDYYGYFDSYKCYAYVNNRFEPQSTTSSKQCSAEWSGDFLNYLSTARIDALRKVLYGGLRSADSATETVLERSYVPQDAHSWGKEYESPAHDGYDITKYTPLPLPMAGRRHLFANTTLLQAGAGEPRLRVLTNRAERVWNWLSIERPVAGDSIVSGIDGGGNEVRGYVTPTDYFVRVKVCVAGLEETNCESYPDGTRKPIGLLQQYGKNDAMYFGLLTGSYSRNTSGGVLRRGVGSINDEVDANNGTFKNYNGIIRTLDRLRVTGFGGNYEYNCGWAAASRTINEGECQMWGNPIGEMMYESLRYFAGKGAATSAFSIGFGAGEESQLQGGGLPVATWDNPYSSRPVCTKPFETVISDINPSYDTDQLPGVAAPFATGFAGDLAGMDVSSLGDKIWNNDPTVAAGNYFIGQSGLTSDGAPTPKNVTSFGNIRGLSPEEPTKRGGFYAASVAYYGLSTDLNPAATAQKLSTFSVALASPLPKIEIPVNGRVITLVPFAKSVAGAGINSAASFQPTDQIVDFYVDTLTPTYGRFRVNFEDVEQGADHDMDAITVYEYSVANGHVDVTLTSEYAAGGITQHMGYVISGTTADGTYLEVLDQRGGDGNADPDYVLDTPPGKLPGEAPYDGVPLPFVANRTFSPGATAGAKLLNDPLWYAAKWGGFEDSNGDGMPDQQGEWDTDNDGTPDNYFLVTNALTLGTQLSKAFDEILSRVGSVSSASVNSGSISTDTRLYQAKFDPDDWHGELYSFPVNPNGTLSAEEWEASELLPAANSRTIFTVNSNRTGVPFRWTADASTGLDPTRKAQLLNGTDTPAVGLARLNYLRGDAINEGPGVGQFRTRVSKLGDIVSSSPVFVGQPPFAYRDNLEAKPYSAFRLAMASRAKTVYVGANDGMLHAFNASPDPTDTTRGAERFAFIPGAVFQNLKVLSDSSYSHQFFVDGSPNMGDAFFNNDWHTVLVGGLNKGGQGIYALDITDPGNFSEANADDQLLWEFTDDPSDPDLGDADLGYTYSQPAIVRLSNGRWAAVFGNGYNNTSPDAHTSSSGRAVLYIVDMENGELIRKIDTETGMAQDPLGRPNGLGTPSVVDLNGDAIADYVFAGDLFGNLWKFDLRDADEDNWDVAYRSGSNVPLPLYIALDSSNRRQPITGRPEVGRGPKGAGMIVLFGTGKFLEGTDKVILPRRDQTFYGIVDPNTHNAASDTQSGRGSLLQQTITYEGIAFSKGIRITTNLPLGSTRGWYLDLLSPTAPAYKGERVVSNPILRDGRIIFTTLIPDPDPCGNSGGSWIMEMDALSGSRLPTTPFDINGDGKFDANDMVDTDGDGVADTYASGVESTVGIVPEPGILAGDNADYKYTPGTSGEIQVTVENPGAGSQGRQSWRQLR